MNRPTTRREAREMIRKGFEDARMDRLDRSVFENALGLEPGRGPVDRTEGELRILIDAMKREGLITINA